MKFRIIRNRIPLVVSVVLSGLIQPSLLRAEEKQLASVTEGQSWSEALALATHGEFAPARDRLAPLLGTLPEAVKVDGWLSSYLEMQKQRSEMTRTDYEKYVEYARRSAGRGKLSWALEYAGQALENRGELDVKTIHAEPWLQELTAQALAKAQEHRIAGEWRDAAGLYSQLVYLFDRSAEYKKLQRECLTHFRLEYIYGSPPLDKEANEGVDPDALEEPRWEESLKGIDPEMVEDSFEYLDEGYVEAADFKSMTLSALEQLLLVARTPGIRETFPSLKDDIYREQFERRIEKRLAEVREKARVTRTTATDQLHQALKINKETLRLPEALLVSEYMQGALEPLDEFTSVIWPTEFREFQKHTDGEFIGVGIQITRPLDEIMVATPLEDTPAYRAGIVSGDAITKIDGQPTKGISLTKAVQRITGPKNTTVTLTIRRRMPNGEEHEMDIPLVRAKVELRTVEGLTRDPDNQELWNHFLDEELGIGYVRVKNFSKKTVPDLQEIINRLQSQGLRALVLDLRNDPGGLLNSAAAMADLFLPKKALIVRTEGLNSPRFDLEGESSREFENLPLTVLINENSASASEIVAGALKDHGRALLIGERSFGKFSVQNLQPLTGKEAALKYTTAWYYLPGGANLHRKDDSETWGVDPHVVVDLVPKEMRKLDSLRRRSELLGPAAPEVDLSEADAESGIPYLPKEDAAVESSVITADAEPKKADAIEDARFFPPDPADEFVYEDTNDRPDIDPQLEAALLLTRIHLLSDQHPLIASSVDGKQLTPG